MYGNNMNNGQYPNQGNGYPGGQYPPQMPPQYNMAPPPKKSNTGLIVGIILFLLIAAAVVFFVIKPFDKETPPTENPPTQNPPAENPPTENPPAENPPTENPPAENPPTENPPTTSTSGYSCTNSASQSGINMIITVDVTDGGSISCKLSMQYTYARENGQAFTEAEKDAISSNLETSLKNTTSIGTVSNYRAELKDGKIIVYVESKLNSCTPDAIKKEFTNEGYTCKELG